MKYTPVGVDIAKHLLQIHLIDQHTDEVIDKQMKRDVLLVYFSNRESCLIGMEAGGGSQYWARELKILGHKIRLLQGIAKRLNFDYTILSANKISVSHPSALFWPLACAH